MSSSSERSDLIREWVEVGPRRFLVVHPPSAEDLIDEDDYARDERLPYWAELWPSARVLADALIVAPIAGRRVLELGCGLGLATLAAVAAGARVLATDWYEEALRFTRQNAGPVGGGRLETLLVDWQHPPTELLRRPAFDLVVAADVLYEARNAAALAGLLPRVVAEDGEAWIADPRRPDAQALFERLQEAGWRHDMREVAVSGRPDESGAIVHVHRLRPASTVAGKAFR